MNLQNILTNDLISASNLAFKCIKNIFSFTILKE